MQLRDRHRSAIEAFLNTPSYRPCLFIVSADARCLAAAVEAIASDYACLEIGSGLCRALLDVMPRQRPVNAQQWVQARLADLRPGPVLCTTIDLLFEPALQLDPLHLFWEHGFLIKPRLAD